MQSFVPRYKVSLNDSRPRHLGVSGSSPRGGHPHKPTEEACLGTQNLGHRAHVRSIALWAVWSPGLDRPGVRPNEQSGRLESCLLLCQPPRDPWGVTTPDRWPGSEQDDLQVGPGWNEISNQMFEVVCFDSCLRYNTLKDHSRSFEISSFCFPVSYGRH